MGVYVLAALSIFLFMAWVISRVRCRKLINDLVMRDHYVMRLSIKADAYDALQKKMVKSPVPCVKCGRLLVGGQEAAIVVKPCAVDPKVVHIHASHLKL